ncbi:MAG: twitching motility protein PilT [Chloroflexi bacterium]|nr:MAG: twitching motility protein PilT [Chloroflexota bacterium]
MTQQATFHFYDRLNFFLPRRQRNKPILYDFDRRASIKDMVEAIGVPHPEVELLIVNQQSVGFDYIVQTGDVVRVYPDYDAIDLPDRIRLIPPYEGRPRFVLDTHLGRLAAYLRMLGFDTLYRNDYPDDALAAISDLEKRILLTRDIGLLKRSRVVYGYYVRETNPRRRLYEIIARYNLLEQAIPFRHCLRCNGNLMAVDKAHIREQLPPNTAKYYDEFHQCTVCKQIYWRGSHYERMQAFINEVMQANGNG